MTLIAKTWSKKDRGPRILYWLPWTQQFIVKVCVTSPSFQDSIWKQGSSCAAGLAKGPLISSNGFWDIPQESLQKLQQTHCTCQSAHRYNIHPKILFVEFQVEVKPCFLPAAQTPSSCIP